MWIKYIIYVLYIIFKVHLFHQKQGSSFVKKEYEFQLCFNISLNTLSMSFEVTGANLLFRLSMNVFFNILLTCNSQSRSFKYLLFIKKKT